MKTIIEMAREAGLIVDANQSGFDSVVAFAALVAQEAADELDLLMELRESHEGTIRALEEQLSAELGVTEIAVAAERERIIKVIESMGTWAHINEVIDEVRKNT